MKKSLYLLLYLILLSFLKSEKGIAQFSYLEATAVSAKVGFCKLPAYGEFSILHPLSGFTMLCAPLCMDSIFLNVNFGDGTTSNYKLFYKPIGASSSMYDLIKDINHSYIMTGVFKPRVILSTKGGYIDTFYAPSFYVSDSCGNVSGKLYIDDNHNCLPDVGELGIKWVKVRFINTATSDTFYTSKLTDTAGKYATDIKFGTYIVTPLINRLTSGIYTLGDTLKAFCPISGSSTLTVLPYTSYTQDFALECKPSDSFDASIHATSLGFVPGSSTLLSIWAGDWWSRFHTSCIGRSTTISFTLDPKLAYVSHLDGIAPSSIVGSTITWRIIGGDISDFKSRILVQTSSSAKIGDTACNTAYIAPIVGYPDPNLSNNTLNYCCIVGSSFDPNMKEVAPKGRGVEGFIPKNIPMTYTIHFQNTGTASAKDITIFDTISNNLDVASFHMINSSHNAEVYLDSNLLKFRFNDIYLPDSSSDYYASMGSVTFGILPVHDLAVGTEIKNRAGIYFDYNEPVITNYTLNTIDNTTDIQQINIGSIKAEVFPNPTDKKLNIKVEKKANFIVTMTDMLGGIVASEQSQNGSISIATQNLAAGMYLLNIYDTEGYRQNTKVIVKH